jgi:hypothetical protein
MMETPGPNAAPRAEANPKQTDAVVRSEKGVTSARQLLVNELMNRVRRWNIGAT